MDTGPDWSEEDSQNVCAHDQDELHSSGPYDWTTALVPVNKHGRREHFYNKAVFDVTKAKTAPSSLWVCTTSGFTKMVFPVVICVRLVLSAERPFGC